MSDRVSSKLIAVIFHISAFLCIGVKGICDVDVNDGTWENFTFPSLPNQTIEEDQCEEILKESATTILILKVISKDPLKQASFKIIWEDTVYKSEVIRTTPLGIVRFINSQSVRICCNKDITCVSNLQVFYKELERGGIQETLTEGTGLIQPLPYCQNGRYRPNSVSFWGIEARNGNVKLTLENFDLDDYAGDYLLIGSSVTNYGNSSDVFQGPRPLFLTGKSPKPKKIIVSTAYQSQIYIVLVSKMVKRTDALGFTIRYQASGERIGYVSTAKPAPTIAESWREAISVCATVPKNDSDYLVNSTVASFIADSVMRRLRNSNAKPIRRSQIKVVTVARQRNRDDEYFALLTVESWDHPNVPLLEADQLRRTLDIGAQAFPAGYKILLCDQIAIDGQWLGSITLAFVPIFFFLLLFLWWIRYKRFRSSMVKKHDEKATFEVEMFPVTMINPAFVPDSPTDEKELPQLFLNSETNKNKLDFNNKDSGFASCSTHPSSVKSTPATTKRKVLFNITPKEDQEEKHTLDLDENLDEDLEETREVRL